MKTAPRFVENILESMLKAHVAGDYEAFSRHATARFQSEVSQQHFEQASAELGAFLSDTPVRRFVGSFRRNGKPVYLFVLTGTDPDNETMVQFCLSDEGDTHLVEWMWIE